MKKKPNTKPRCRFIMTILLGLSAIAGLVLSSTHNLSNTSALTYESEQGVAFTFNPTVSLSLTGDLFINNLTPGDVKDSNIITVSASANTPLGYSLSSTVGSSTYNTTELRKDGTSTANKFTNLTANVSSLSNFSDNTWGYSYSTDSGSTWISGDITSTTATGYNGLPIYTTSSPIKLINSSTAGSSSIQFKIGAKASTSQIAGTYNNVINFIGTSKVVTTTYTINYNDPSGEADPTTIPATQQGIDTTGNAAVKISSTVPVRENYMFKGWCTSQTSDDTCSSDVVQPGGYVALNPGTSSTTATVNKTIYAMWESNIPMQNLTNCPTKVTSVVDTRDGERYLIQKLNDGNCWMLQNLKLGRTVTSQSPTLTLTTANSDVSGNYTLNYSDIPADSKFHSYTIDGVDGQNNSTEYYCTGDGTASNWESCYYNWYTATAGTGTTYVSTEGQNVNNSICPAGWTLPTQPQFQQLYNQYPSAAEMLVANPTTTKENTPTVGQVTNTPGFLLSGNYYTGGAGIIGSYGLYWSRTAYSAPYAYRLVMDTSTVYPVDRNAKYLGFPVRCLMRQ